MLSQNESDSQNANAYLNTILHMENIPEVGDIPPPEDVRFKETQEQLKKQHQWEIEKKKDPVRGKHLSEYRTFGYLMGKLLDYFKVETLENLD